MTDILLILIFLSIVLLLCVICGGIGFLVALRVKSKPKEKTPVQPPTIEQTRQAERRQREDYNFTHYDGSEQEDFSA